MEEEGKAAKAAGTAACRRAPVATRIRADGTSAPQAGAIGCPVKQIILVTTLRAATFEMQIKNICSLIVY